MDRNHLLMASIFKLHKCETFGLMKMHTMSKIWFANNKVNLLRWNKLFFMIFQGPSVARNCLRPETFPLTILAIKRGHLAKLLRTAILRDIVAQIWNYWLQLNSKSSNFSLHSPLKNMLKIPILDLKKRGHFIQFLLYI